MMMVAKAVLEPENDATWRPVRADGLEEKEVEAAYLRHDRL
jgi:hypothetical protein